MPLSLLSGKQQGDCCCWSIDREKRPVTACPGDAGARLSHYPSQSAGKGAVRFLVKLFMPVSKTFLSQWILVNVYMPSEFLPDVARDFLEADAKDFLGSVGAWRNEEAGNREFTESWSG